MSASARKRPYRAAHQRRAARHRAADVHDVKTHIGRVPVPEWGGASTTATPRLPRLSEGAPSVNIEATDSVETKDGDETFQDDARHDIRDARGARSVRECV